MAQISSPHGIRTTILDQDPGLRCERHPAGSPPRSQQLKMRGKGQATLEKSLRAPAICYGMPSLPWNQLDVEVMVIGNVDNIHHRNVLFIDIGIDMISIIDIDIISIIDIDMIDDDDDAGGDDDDDGNVIHQFQGDSLEC